MSSFILSHTVNLRLAWATLRICLKPPSPRIMIKILANSLGGELRGITSLPLPFLPFDVSGVGVGVACMYVRKVRRGDQIPGNLSDG